MVTKLLLLGSGLATLSGALGHKKTGDTHYRKGVRGVNKKIGGPLTVETSVGAPSLRKIFLLLKITRDPFLFVLSASPVPNSRATIRGDSEPFYYRYNML